jgi:hypothetical protein
MRDIAHLVTKTLGDSQEIPETSQIPLENRSGFAATEQNEGPKY